MVPNKTFIVLQGIRPLTPRALISFGVMAMIFLSASCQEKAPSKAPVKKENSSPAVDTGDALPEVASTINDEIVVTITPVTQTGPTFTFAKDTQVLVKFSITGPTSGSEINVGLVNPVTGGSLSTSNAMAPEFSWNPGSQTEVDFRLIVRNKAKCAKVAASPSACDFKSGQSIAVNSQYDTQSTLYKIKIGDTGTGTGTGSPLNAAMIQQILGMMTGGTGGTGATGGAGLPGILAGLSGGQLSTLLATLQGSGSTGGGGDLMSILTTIMGGMTLTGEPIPGAVIMDASAAEGLNLTGGRR